MQRCVIYKSFTVIGVFSLLMIISIAAIAGSYDYQYSLQLAGGQSNPWALPGAAGNSSGFQQPQNKYQNQQNQQNQQYQGRPRQNRASQDRAYQADRFVTPEFLESLKRQQTQHQMMPDDKRILQFAPRESVQQRPQSSLPGAGSFSCPSDGVDYMNPLYDTPAVTPWSPWGIGSDVW